jgi:hypothetical protein
MVLTISSDCYPKQREREEEGEEEEEEESWGVSERHYRFGGGCNRNIIWQFGRFPDSSG